ncbi:MAG: hypothetical protein NVS9B1_17550 [Candidatus Dormibacteraceae bacterium]
MSLPGPAGVAALIALALPLSLDTFAISAALGVAGIAPDRRLRVSLVMVAFEMGMPVVGVLLGTAAGEFAGSYADFAAIALLAGLGLWILRPGQDEDQEQEQLARIGAASGLGMIGLGLSISLDELAVGVSLGLLRFPLLAAVLLIGAQALIASQLGLRLGARLGEAVRERSEKAAGLVLILLAAVLLVLRLR